MSVTQPTFNWDFRQTVSAGGTVTDSISGNVATLTSSNASCSVSDGLTVVSDNSTTSGWADFQPFTADITGYTVEVYFMIGSVSWWPVLFQIGDQTSSNALGHRDGLIRCVFDEEANDTFGHRHISNDAMMNRTGSMNENQIYHLVITFDAASTTFTVYEDGNQVFQDTDGSNFLILTGSTGSTYPSISSLNKTFAYNRIGARGDGLRGINGNVYYTRFWNGTAITSSEVSTLYANRAITNYFSTTYESGFVPTFDYDFRVGNKDLINGTAEAKYYQYSSGTSTEITKENTINGVSIVGDTPTAAVSGSSSGRDNAGGQYIDLTGDLDTSYDQITIEVYVNIDSTTGKEVDNAGIFHFGNADRVEMFKIYTNYGTKDYINMIAQYNENASSSITQFTTSSLIQNLCDGNTYMHLVYTCNGPTMTVYLNGASFLTQTDNSFSFGSATRSVCELGRSSMYSTIGGFIFATYKYCRIYNTALSSTQAATLYNNRDSVNHLPFASLRSLFGDVYLAQTLNKTIEDYKNENIPLHDVSFGAFPANKYKQSYAKTLLDLSGDFVHRKHTFYGDISFNNDLSVNNFMVVNNDVSLNAGLVVNGDASFNGNVNAIGDVSLNGTLKLKDKSIETSALNFTVIANEGTFDSAQDVSLNSTFTIQGDFDKYIDTAGNIQTDFSENVVLIPGSLGLDLSGGSATLSGKTGDQAFLNGTYIVKDNSGNTTGNIYDDINENTTSTPGVLSATPDYYWDFRVATPSGNTLADRVSGINATYYGGITSSETTGASFTERSGWSSFSGNTQTQYIKPGDIVPGTNFTVEYYVAPNYTFNGFGQLFRIVSTSNGTLLALSSVYYPDGMNIGVYFYPDDGVSYNVMTHSGSGNVYAIPYNTPSQVVVSYDDSNKVFKIYINGSLWSITYDDSSRATGATAENTSYGYASGTAVSNAEGSITCDNSILGASSLTTNNGRPFEGNFYYVRHYKDKILTDADVAILYANASTINWDFQTAVNNNKLTSLPKNWNSVQVNSRGNWVYDGSSNYTSYLDEYGHSHTVKGDNYDLTLPFHFYPSKAFLRTTPLLPASSSINPHNYPASVKFLGTSAPDSNYDNVTLPTYNWDFRVDTSTSINDSTQNVTATYYQTSSTVEDGLTFTGEDAHASIPAGILINNGPSEVSWELYFKYTIALGAWDIPLHLYLNSTNELRFAQYGTNGYFTFRYGNVSPTNIGSDSDSNREHKITNLSTSTLVDTWIHLIATVEYPTDYTTNGTTIRFYHNGSLINTVTGGGYNTGTLATTSSNSNSIGANHGSTATNYNSSGNIRYLRFYNKKLSEAEVKILYSNSNVLNSFANIGNKYHLLGEFSNKAIAVTADSSANYTYNSVVHKTIAQDDANIGTIPTFSWDFRQNVSAGGTVTDIISGNVATLSSTNASCTTSGGLTLVSDNTASGTGWADYEPFTPSSDGFSLEIYFKIGDISWWPVLLVAGTSQTGGDGTFINAVFQHGGGSTFSNRHSINATSMAASTNMNENTDYHLVITLDAVNTVFTVYINGSQIVQHTSGSGFNNGFPDVSSLSTTTYNRIGARGDDLRGINGNVYYARIWNGTAITSTHVSSLYAARTTSNIYSNTQTYLHGADFLYNLNRKYYINQLRMVVDQAPDSSASIYPSAPTHFWNFRVDQTINSGDSIQDSISGVNGTFNTTKTLTSSLGFSNTSSITEAVTIDSMEIQGTFSFEFYGQLTSINTVGASPFFNLRKTDGAGGYNDTARRTEFKTASNGKLLFYTDLNTNGVIYSDSAFTAFNTDVHLIIVFNNDDLTAKVYQNGSLLIEDTMTGPRVTDTFDHFDLFNTYDYNRGLFCHAYQVRMWNGTALTASEVSSIYTNLTTGNSGNYGQYSIDRLAYSGSSFSGKKLENSYPNLYLNTAAHDISYGFTEDHTNIVYDLSHNKNQLPIIDMSGAGGIHIAPREISIQDGSLNTINIHKPTIKNTYSKPYAIMNQGVSLVTQPGYDWNFLVNGAANSNLSDNISGATATYGSNVTSDTTNGVLYNGDGGPGVDDITLPNNIEFSSSFSIEFIFRVNNNSDPYRAIWKFGSGTTNNIFCDTYSTNQKLRIWMLSNSSTITFNSSLTGTHTGATMNFDGSTFHHVVFRVDSSIGEAAYYQDGVKVWYQTGINLSESNFPLISSAYSGIGDVNEGGNMNFKKFRIWNNYALTETEIQNLYNNQSTNYSSNDWGYHLFTEDFYSHFGVRDASGHFNKRISQDGKTIVTLQNRGTQAYDLSNTEVVFSTDYGKNWKNILRDCSDSFLFTEHDISYGLLFATGDVSGAIDIATSSNGQTMYVGRHRSIFSDANTLTYGELGYIPAQEISIPAVAATNTHTHNNYGGNVTNFRYFPQCFIGNNTGASDITVSNLTGNEAAFNGTFKVSMSSGLSITNSGHRNLWGLLGTDTWSGQYAVNGYTLQVSDFNNNRPTVSYVGGSVTLHYLLLEFPSYVKFDTWYYWVDDRFRTGYFIGTDANGDNQLLGSWSDSWNNGQAIYARSFNGANNTYVNKLYIMLDNQSIAWGYLQPMWFTGTYQLPETRGTPIPNGLPEIYSTNYGNSWKLSPRKYHKGPTIISGDGSTILILQESKLDNAKHAYASISGHGNNNPYVDTHWITKDYGSNWNTLNRSGYDISNNVIPPSYGSKTATFLKACMSYTGQYIYIYNVQCTTNNNYGELYYSHDYGDTWNKWTTSEAQNYVASGNTLAGSGQILCSGNGKYVFIAGQTASSSRLSQAIYYRSTDYGVTFNKDITTFPWQEGSSGEDSTSRGPFISYEGDLIVISNTHYKYIDDSDATISYGSSQYSGLKYSLDYGVNYNVLELNEEPLSTVTNNFSNLPNQTNKFFSSLFSTKGDIFSNCPGPNDYSFLTTVMGGNTTDASFVFLQSIEFSKDKVSTTVEKEGPVITTYEEPIDTENDFGNITNTTSLTSGVSYYSSAISEDGQVLLTAGATDISNGSYYGAYNLTNAKFPPTENVNDSMNIISKPILDFDFRVASTTGITDSISGVAISYLGDDTSTVSGGYYKSDYNINDRPYTTSSTFSGIGTNFSVEFYFMHGNTSADHNTRSAFTMKNTTTGEYISFGQDGEFKNRVVTYINGTTGARWHNTTSGRDTKIHLTFVYDYDNQVARYYENSSYLDAYTTQYIATTHVSHLDDGNLKAFSSGTSTVFDSFTWCGSTAGRVVGDANYYYTRVWDKALTQTEIDYLYANRDTVSASLASNWTVSPYNNLPQFRTANLSYNGNHALLVPYGLTQQHQQKLIYWTASGDFHRFDGNYLSNFDAENWKFGKLSGNGNFFVGFTHSSSTLSDASYNSATWWQDKVSNTMIIYKNLYTMPRGTVSDSDATTYGQGTTYDLNTAFSTDSGVTEYYITSVHVSETGQYVLFVGGNSATTLTNRCAFSKDYGTTFTNITSLFSFTDITKPLVYCHVSDNGRYLFISQYNSSEYCFSTDYGSSFTLHNTFPSSTKTYGVVSKDGQNALFVDTNKHVYVSVNGNFRQEVIPSLSGTNTNLSLNHNYWKYKTTTSTEITYNPSMPNIKYLIGTVSDPYLINHYLFENNYNDSSGKGNHLTEAHTSHTFSENTSFTSIPISYYVNTARASVDFTQNVPLSIAFWWNPQAGSSTYTPFSIGSADNTTGYAIQVDMHPTGGAIGFYHNFTGGGASVSYTVPADVKNYNFSHYVLTIDSSSLVTLYFNGSSVSTAQGSGNLQNVEKLHIGRDWDNNRFNIGRHGDFRVYKKALSASEASNIYNQVALSEVAQQNLISTSNVRYTESYFSELDIKGSLTNLSGTAYTSSDYRVKENVRDLEDSDSIASLTPISYTQNNLHHKKSIGFLAHEFAESFPDLVDGTKDGPEMQSINYNGIIAVLIKEIQTLRAKINKLKSEI